MVEVARKTKDTKSGSHDAPDYSNLESEYGNVECKNKLSSNSLSIFDKNDFHHLKIFDGLSDNNVELTDPARLPPFHCL